MAIIFGSDFYTEIRRKIKLAELLQESEELAQLMEELDELRQEESFILKYGEEDSSEAKVELREIRTSIKEKQTAVDAIKVPALEKANAIGRFDDQKDLFINLIEKGELPL